MADKVDQHTLGQVIRNARSEAGLSLRGLASKLSKHPSYLSDIENDKRVPSEEVLHNISVLLNLDFDQLMAQGGRLGKDAEDYLIKHPTAGAILRLISSADLQEEDLKKLLQTATRLCRKKEDAKNSIQVKKKK